jgi:hypothetical protein
VIFAAFTADARRDPEGSHVIECFAVLREYPFFASPDTRAAHTAARFAFSHIRAARTHRPAHPTHCTRARRAIAAVHARAVGQDASRKHDE